MSIKLVWQLIFIVCFIFSVGTISILFIYEKLVENFVNMETIVENNNFKKLFIKNVQQYHQSSFNIDENNINYLKENDDYNKFTEELRDLIKFIDNIESLCIYDKNNNIIFQENSECITSASKPIKQSITNAENNNIIIKDTISLKHKDQYINYIISFNKSIDIIKIKNLTIIISLIEISLLLLSLGVLIYISKYLIKLLKKQFEINLEIKKEKDDILYNTSNRSIFFTNIVHELRTPLNGILGFTTIILQSNIKTLTRKYLEEIQASANELLSFIHDILDLSKANANQLEISSKLINLNAAIKSTIKSMLPLFKKKDINVIVDISEKLLIINADPIRLRQVFKNIFSNSIKFSNNNSNITVRIVSLPGRIEISIIDEGIGIPEEDIANVMNIFGQSSNSNINYKGTGLGLPLSKKLIEGMGAHFFITSKINQGTTIKLTFPINDEILCNERNKMKELME